MAGLLVCGALALVLLWRLPPGPPDLPAVRVALALSLALLIASPYQQAWYDAMIFPLFAVVAASRLDWVAAAHAIALAVIFRALLLFPTHIRRGGHKSSGSVRFCRSPSR